MASCFCTGRCRQPGGVCPANPRPHPPRPPLQRGWICPLCGNVNSPWNTTCVMCPRSPVPPRTPWRQPWQVPSPSQCSCPANSVCMNTACPRRVVVTCGNTATDGWEAI